MRISSVTLLLMSVSILAILRGTMSLLTTTNGGFITPNIYHTGDHVELVVNKIESDMTPIPYAYYDLPFTCPPTGDKKPLHLSLNEIIQGDHKWESDYKLTFGKDNECTVLCARKTTKSGMDNLREMIQNGYVVQWLIDDDLPASTTFISTTTHKKHYAAGFPLGYVEEDTGKLFVNNHVMMVIRYQAINDYDFAIVGFEIYPKSVSDYHCPGASKDYEPFEVTSPVNDDDLNFIPFTYSVYWREEFEVTWETRFDMFLTAGELSQEISTNFHWISLGNSFGIVLLMTFIVSLILIKINKTDKDGNDYEFDHTTNKDDNSKNSIFIIARSWYHNDKNPLPHIFIFLVSMGVQFTFTIIGSLTISCSLNKIHNVRRSVLSMALLFFILGAFMASYVGTSLAIENNKLVSRRGSLKNIIVNSTIFPIVCGSLLPGLVMAITICLNCTVWLYDDSTVLPFSTIVKLIALYFIVCIPLSIFGGILAKNTISHKSSKLRRDSIKRNTFDLKSSVKFLNETVSSHKKNLLLHLLTPIKNILKKLIIDSFTLMIILLSGIFPFIIIYVELQFVYKSMWLENTTFYYFYGFLLTNIILLCLVIAEISIISSYIMLTISGNDYSSTWRWKSFQLASSCAWYMELFSLYYLFNILNVRGFSFIFLSVCYSLLFNVLCGLAMGSIGYLTTFYFIRHVFKIRFKK